MGLFERWSLNVLFIFASFIYIAGLFIDVYEIDSAQYAAISGEMHRTGNYLEVYQNGIDYLDKPPLVFWTANLMYKIFGESNWSFKLSSFLFSLIALISTYKVGYLLYNKRTGFVAAIILLTSQAFFIFNNDVRTDTLLTGAVIFSVWQLVAYFYTRKWQNFVLAFVAIGLAMLAKGPIGLVVPAMAFGSYLIGRDNFKQIFKLKWLLGLGITAMVLLPMSIGLYTQFDAHPEKELHLPPNANEPRTEVSGLHFYYWEQSFGRITGENEWKDSSGYDFFIGIFLYSFLPWSLIGLWAIFWRVFNAVRDFALKRKKQEWLTLGGFVLPFIAFSMSHFKLDHYIYVTYPFAAIIVSEFILRVVNEKPRWWKSILLGMQGLVIFSSLFIATFILSYVLPNANFFIWAGFTVLMGLTFYFFFFDKDKLHKIVLASVFVSLAANWVFNIHFYPKIARTYQVGRQFAETIVDKKIDLNEVYIMDNTYRHGMNFYTQSNLQIASINNLQENDLRNHWVFVKDAELQSLKALYPKLEIVETYYSYPITRLSMKFLLPETRKETLESKYLIFLKSE